MGNSDQKKVVDKMDPADIPACYSDTNGIMTTTMNYLPGYKVVRNLGTVYGLTVRSRNWGAELGMFVKSAVGGELPWLTTMIYRSRNDAMERVVGECMGRGGNAIIALRFDFSDLGNAYAQTCAYGTAVEVRKLEDGEEDVDERRALGADIKA